LERMARVAEKEERRRIARDLHDNIAQQVAVLQIGIEQLKRDLPEPSKDVAERLQELVNEASNLSSDLRALSHGLHAVTKGSDQIDRLLKQLCVDVSKRLGIDVQ